MFSVQDQESIAFKLNKKLRSSLENLHLSYKAKEDAILVLDDLSFETPKTKDYTSVLENLKIDGDKSLIRYSEKVKILYLSSRNLKKLK